MESLQQSMKKLLIKNQFTSKKLSTMYNITLNKCKSLKTINTKLIKNNKTRKTNNNKMIKKSKLRMRRKSNSTLRVVTTKAKSKMKRRAMRMTTILKTNSDLN